MIALLAAKLGVGEILLIISCSLIVVGVVAAAIARKIKGKSGCGGNCSCCSNCHHSESIVKKDNTNQD